MISMLAKRESAMNSAVEFYALQWAVTRLAKGGFLFLSIHPIGRPLTAGNTMLCMRKNHFRFLTQHNCYCGAVRLGGKSLLVSTPHTSCLHFGFVDFLSFGNRLVSLTYRHRSEFFLPMFERMDQAKRIFCHDLPHTKTIILERPNIAECDSAKSARREKTEKR